MSDFERYRKQMLFSGIGENGQEQISRGRILVVGCGALGTVIADSMVRAGVGFVRIVDRDFVELSNLQRQILFDEEDVRRRIPKAIAAAEKLRKINSSITIEACVEDVDFANVRSMVNDVDLILDGSDNFEVRFLINDVSLETRIPWIYAGCVGSHAQSMPVFPGESACLRCLIGDVPDAGATETCDTAGVLGPAISVIASLQSIQALKILTGQSNTIRRVLTIVDVWDGVFREMDVSKLRATSGCPACHQQERLWLSGRAVSSTSVLCGRNAVQISPSEKRPVDLDDMALRLATVGKIDRNRFLLRISLHESELEITLFRDGRAIIQGTEDIAAARAAYARYIGL